MAPLDDFRSDDPDENGGIDYTDYDDDLADRIDSLVENDSWRSNRKQPYYVVNTAERVLTMSGPPDIDKRRKAAQSSLAKDLPVRHQTLQAACHVALFDGYEVPPTNYRGGKQWHVLFERVLRNLESDYRSHLPQ